MNKPFLFIETPRAGKHNHRFIVPTDYISGDGILSQWADFARQKTESNDYIGAKREAKQQSSGRTGWEQIILAGVNTKLLSKEQMEAIRTFLTERLLDVERLVTQTINWEQATKIIVPHPELNQWLQELEQRLGVPIPAMPQEIKSQIKIKSASKRRWFMELVIGSVIISGFSIWIANNLDKNDLGVPTPNHQEQQNLKTAKEKANRLILAIGGDDKDKVKSELEKRFGSYNSDTWKSKIGDKIKDSGPWLVSMFFQNIDGNAITTGLWGKNISQLQIADTLNPLQPIADTPNPLQPLVQCRIAIRKLMGIEEAVYTPFFKPEDFNAANNPLTAVEDKIYAWTDRAHPDAVKVMNRPHPEAVTGRGCDTKPNASENLLHWITECLIPIGGVFADDKNLQRIKNMGEDCSKVKFISPIVSNTGTTKKMK